MSLSELARRAREQHDWTQEEWATRAGVSRSVARQFEGGANVTRDTMEKLLTPLGMTLLLMSKKELAEARKKLEEVEQFLGRMLDSSGTITKMLAPLGLAPTILTADEIAGARAQLQEVLQYLAAIEEQAAHSREEEGEAGG